MDFLNKLKKFEFFEKFIKYWKKGFLDCSCAHVLGKETSNWAQDQMKKMFKESMENPYHYL
jgi:hypothetical protein